MLEAQTSLPVADADGALRRRPWCALIIFVTTCCSTRRWRDDVRSVDLFAVGVGAKVGDYFNKDLVEKFAKKVLFGEQCHLCYVGKVAKHVYTQHSPFNTE